MKKKGIIILNKDFSREWLPILKESGINTIGFHSLYQFGGVEGHLDWLLNEDTQKLIAEFEANGFEIEHQLHAVDWLLPRSFFKLHPEWFRVNDKGERVNDWNLCVSNREALSFLETSAYKLALLLRQKSHYYYIWSDDCVNSVCYCDRCRRYGGADQNMIIMKHVLKGLKRYDQEAKLSFLSYQDSSDVLTIQPDQDMFLEFAPIGRNHAKALDGNDEANVKARKTLEELLKIFPAETTQILEYFLDVSLFCQWKRENAKALDLDAEKLGRDISYYASLGVGGITTFSGFMDGEWRAKYGDGDIRLYGKALDEFFVRKNGKPWQNCITAASMGSAGDEANSLTGRYDTIEKTFR